MAKAGPESCSFDLTNATHRFPLLPQKLVVSQLFGAAIGESWAGLMTDRTFIIKNVGTVRWSRGQPLGFYSSWAVFALTHHAIIEYCAEAVGVKSFRDYAVLGDDVVI